ncbi:hypothetical protein [Tenacibaculum sediminilitoris]|uniref:hypothetical protein n=1 Tax=Tenacibaculum sediminilitoris TaxID=1820334 RepID=UPI0038B4C090
MKKQIFTFGKALNRAEQKEVKGGNDQSNSRGCYEQPVSNVNCISPWEYIPGCGYTCMVAPTEP